MGVGCHVQDAGWGVGGARDGMSLDRAIKLHRTLCSMLRNSVFFACF